VVSDDFTKSKGCDTHVPCRGGDCIVRSYEGRLRNIAYDAARERGIYAINIRPYPSSVKGYFWGDEYCAVYKRSDLFYGDKEKYDPKKVYEELPYVVEKKQRFEFLKNAIYKWDCLGLIKNGGKKDHYDKAIELIFPAIRDGELCAVVLADEIERVFKTWFYDYAAPRDEVLAIAKEIIDKSPGDKYEGESLHGKPHGTGKMYYVDGTVYTGGFEKGYFHGKGVIDYANGDKLDGEFDYRGGRDYFAGNGTMYHADGSRYEGEFNYGDKYGWGIEYDHQGNIVYEGEWEHGMRYPCKIKKT